MSIERVFIFGGTGNIGGKVVKDLLSKSVALTLYARNPEKVNTMFPNSNIRIAQGDLSNLSSFKEAIKGHTRLFLLISEYENFVSISTEIATTAYASGVKQIVNISSESVNFGWRTSYTGGLHFEAERKIYDIPNRGWYVALRPTRFMSNIFHFDRPSDDGIFGDTVDANQLQSWISPNDIGAVAATLLSEDPNKYGDTCLTLIGDTKTPIQREEIFSRVLNREIKFKRVTTLQKIKEIDQYNLFPYYITYDICTCGDHPSEPISTCIPVLLGREPETLEEYLIANKESFNTN